MHTYNLLTLPLIKAYILQFVDNSFFYIKDYLYNITLFKYKRALKKSFRPILHHLLTTLLSLK